LARPHPAAGHDFSSALSRSPSNCPRRTFSRFTRPAASPPLRKKYRYPVALPDFIAHAPRQRPRNPQSLRFDGNKRQHIRRAYARVRPECFVRSINSMALPVPRMAASATRPDPRQRDHAPVMVGVHFAIQHINTGTLLMAVTMASTFAGSRLRKKFGTHSISLFIFRFLSCFPAQFAGNLAALWHRRLSYTNTGFFPCCPAEQAAPRLAPFSAAIAARSSA